MLLWFDLNPWAHVLIIFLLVCALTGVVLRGLFDERSPTVSSSDWRWGAAILLMLIAGRWPTLFLSRQFNTDEGFQIVGAATLRHDPLFWRSIFGTTTGPLDSMFCCRWARCSEPTVISRRD